MPGRGQFDWAELRHFRYLLAVLEKQGLRAAAEDLHTSQPNLSVQARQFQENAAIRLYRKTKSGRIRPTETGVAFVALSRQLLEFRDEVIVALKAIEQGELKTIRFGCAPLVAPEVFRSLCRFHQEILPTSAIRATFGNSSQLVDEVLAGAVDAALVTLPLAHPDLRIEVLRRYPMVACMRKDSTLAQNSTVQIAQLRKDLTILCHPQLDPEGHDRLVEMLAQVGIDIGERSYATHPLDMQRLVKDGYGVALLREGEELDPELTTRPISGVRWTVDIAAIYNRSRYPKTVPIALRNLRKLLSSESQEPTWGSELPVARRNPHVAVHVANTERPQLKLPLVESDSSGRSADK